MNLLDLFVRYLFAAMFGMAPQPMELKTPEDYNKCINDGKMVVQMAYKPEPEKEWITQDICIVVPAK